MPSGERGDVKRVPFHCSAGSLSSFWERLVSSLIDGNEVDGRVPLGGADEATKTHPAKDGQKGGWGGKRREES